MVFAVRGLKLASALILGSQAAGLGAAVNLGSDFLSMAVFLVVVA